MTNSSQCYFQENGPRKLIPHGGRLLKTIQFQYFACHTNVSSSAALSEKTRVVSCFKIKFINTNVLLWEVTFNTSTQWRTNTSRTLSACSFIVLPSWKENLERKRKPLDLLVHHSSCWKLKEVRPPRAKSLKLWDRTTYLKRGHSEIWLQKGITRVSWAGSSTWGKLNHVNGEKNTTLTIAFRNWNYHYTYFVRNMLLSLVWYVVEVL